jgi:hypothetical protein
MINRKKILFGFLIFCICYNSCNHVRNKTNITYDVVDFKHPIISKVIDTIAGYISPRTLSPITAKWRFTKEDSIKANKKMVEFVKKFRTIGIDTSLSVNVPNFETSEKMFVSEDFSAIKKAYDSSEVIYIDIKKIKLKKVTNSFYFDSITYLNPSKHIRESRRGTYIDIDYRFNFSEVVYNKDKTIAAIRCFYSFEYRYPDGAMFLFEKKKDDWIISATHYFLGY